MGVGVGAVDEHPDVVFPGELDDLPDRKDLPGEVGDVRHLDDASPRGDRPTEDIDEVVGGWRRDRERNLGQHDAIAPHALIPAGEHPPVVLVRDQHFVAALEVEPEDQRLERLGGVAGDRHLLGIAAEVAGQVAPHALDPRLQDLPHVSDRELIAEPQVADHRLEHVGGRGTDATVVEVDHRAIGVERALDLAPVRLVVGASGGIGRIDPLAGQQHLTHGRLTECGQHRAGTGHGMEKLTAG